MRKKHYYVRGKKNTLSIAFIFCSIVVFLILVSLVFKLILLAKKSKFDGGHRFTIVVSDGSPTVLSFAPDVKTISVASFAGHVSPAQIERYIEAPIDGEMWVRDSSSSSLSEQKDVAPFLLSVLRQYPRIHTNLTVLDFIRLFFFARTVPTTSIIAEQFPQDSDDVAVDKISSSLFNDYTLSTEKMSIHIINGTGVAGLGNRLARLITNAGGNVISVTSSDDTIDNSQISCSKIDSYTCTRLSSLLNFDIHEGNTSGIADIEIMIGKKNLSSLSF